VYITSTEVSVLSPSKYLFASYFSTILVETVVQCVGPSYCKPPVSTIHPVSWQLDIIPRVGFFFSHPSDIHKSSVHKFARSYPPQQLAALNIDPGYTIRCIWIFFFGRETLLYKVPITNICDASYDPPSIPEPCSAKCNGRRREKPLGGQVVGDTTGA
jgi:hypothetical protein